MPFTRPSPTPFAIAPTQKPLPKSVQTQATRAALLKLMKGGK